MNPKEAKQTLLKKGWVVVERKPHETWRKKGRVMKPVVFERVLKEEGLVVAVEPPPKPKGKKIPLAAKEIEAIQIAHIEKAGPPPGAVRITTVKPPESPQLSLIAGTPLAGIIPHHTAHYQRRESAPVHKPTTCLEAVLHQCRDGSTYEEEQMVRRLGDANCHQPGTQLYPPETVHYAIRALLADGRLMQERGIGKRIGLPRKEQPAEPTQRKTRNAEGDAA